MEGIVFFGILMLIWVFIVPIFGLIGFSRSGRMADDVSKLQAELSSLRAAFVALKSADSPASKDQAGAQPEPLDTLDVRAEAVPIQEIIAEEVPVFEGVTPNTRTEPNLKRPQSNELKQPKRGLEQVIAANWMVWIGGAALALGGLFLVRVAIDAGVFGPLTRTLTAVGLGVGLIYAAFKAGDMKLVERAGSQLRYLPPILAGAGIITLYGAGIAAGLIYGFVPPLIMLLFFVIISAVAVWLAVTHSSVLAVIGLGGAYLAPILTGAEPGSVLPILPYALILTGAGLMIIRQLGWQVLFWVILIGASSWGLIGLGASDPNKAWAVPAYALGLGVTGAAFAFRDATSPLALETASFDLSNVVKVFSATLTAAHIFWALGCGLVFFAGYISANTVYATLCIALFGLSAFALGTERQGFVLLAPITGATALLSLALWSAFPFGLLVTCLVVAAGFSGLGALFIKRHEVQAPYALLVAILPPIALFVAFWRQDAETSFVWGITALFMAAISFAFFMNLNERDPEFKKHSGAGAVYALGAFTSAVLAPFLVFSGLWLGTSVAVLALGIAWVGGRFDRLVWMRRAGHGAAVLAMGLMLRPGMLANIELSTMPILNELTAGYGLAACALGAAAWLRRNETHVRRVYEAGALILFFALIGLTIRHIAGNGNLYGPLNGLGELSAYSISYLAMGVSLAYRFRASKSWMRVLEGIAALIGAGAVLLSLLAASGQWVGALPIVNLLLPAFAMPALLMAAYAAVLRRTDRQSLALYMGWSAIVLGFIWVTLETTRGLVGAVLISPGSSGLWAYTASWLAYALGLLLWSVLRNRVTARYASLAILLLSVAKLFLLDMSELEGLARAFSFIGLGGTLIGVALFYQKFIFEQKPAI